MPWWEVSTRFLGIKAISWCSCSCWICQTLIRNHLHLWRGPVRIIVVGCGIKAVVIWLETPKIAVDSVNALSMPQQMQARVNKQIVSCFVLLWLQVVVLCRVYGWNTRQPSSLLGLQKQGQQPLNLVLTNQIFARFPSTSVHHSGLHSPQHLHCFGKERSALTAGKQSESKAIPKSWQGGIGNHFIKWQPPHHHVTVIMTVMSWAPANCT